MTVTINNDIPPPPPSIGGRPRKYPFPDMDVGNSFAIPLSGSMVAGEDHAVVRLRSAAAGYMRKYGGHFIARIDRENNVARCWRVE